MRILLVLLFLASAPAFAQTPDSTEAPVYPELAEPTPPRERPRVPTPAPVPPPVKTPPSGPALDATFDIGFGWGGDDVLDVYFTNGGDQTIQAGQGFVFAAGLLGIPSRRVPIDLRAAAGYKVALTAADDANIRISRFTFEAGAGVTITPDVRAGLVLVQHAGTTVHGDGFFDNVDLGSGTGGAVEGSWRGIGVTYTAIRYTSEDGDEFDGSNIALSYRARLPLR